MFSKVSELCLFIRLESCLDINKLQLGFIPKKSFQKALFTLETEMNYIKDRGSPVYKASLNILKAFERVNHYTLFITLMGLGLPLYIS